MNLRIFLLKTERTWDFLTWESSFFHLIMVDRKKRVFKKVVFCVNKGDIMYISSQVQRASGRNQAE